MVISCWSSIDTMSLSPTVAEILSVIIWITIFPFNVNTLETNFGDFGGGIGIMPFFSNLSLAAAERHSVSY